MSVAIGVNSVHSGNYPTIMGSEFKFSLRAIEMFDLHAYNLSLDLMTLLYLQIIADFVL